MPKIDENTIERIKATANIVDVVGEFVQLKRAGVNFTGLCPFHDDHTVGSFMVSPSKNIARCFPCDKTWRPVDFVMQHEGLSYPDALRWLAQMYKIDIDDEPVRFTPTHHEPRPLPPPPPPLPKRYWPLAWVQRFRADETDTFVHWLHTLPWNEAQRARIPQVLADYGIGHSHIEERNRHGDMQVHDFTIFWQIDNVQRLNNGHLMKYKPDGHRVKEKSQYPTDWIHSRMKRAKKNPFNPDKEAASYCLFGLHLVNRYPDARVNIVESEKTAVIMSVAYGDMKRNLWMACYGLGNLVNTNRLLQPLVEMGKTIVLYPDHDGIEKWKAAARQYPGAVSVNTEPVTKWWVPADGEKADVADIIIRMMREGSEDRRVKSEKFATDKPQRLNLNSQIKETPAPTPDTPPKERSKEMNEWIEYPQMEEMIDILMLEEDNH